MIDELTDAVKDTGKEIAGGIKEAAAKRFAGALPAYIATSWLAFNWSNIALLFMSKTPVEQRIQTIIGQPNIYIEYLLFPITTGIILALITPVAEYLIKISTSKFDVGARRAEQAAEQVFTEKLNKKAEDILLRENRITQLKVEKEELIKENQSLTEKSDELLRSIRSGYDTIVSIVLRSTYLSEKISEKKQSGELSQETLKDLFEKSFTTQEITIAYKRRAAIQAEYGPTAANYLFEGNPLPLEANDKLVKELLVATGIISASTVNRRSDNNEKTGLNLK